MNKQNQKLGISTIKKEFPVFEQYPNLVYLDNAATTQKPQMVLDGIQQSYISSYANVHRGIYKLAAKATNNYESAREKVKEFINAPNTETVIFTKGTTEGINLVAQSYLSNILQEGDEVVISEMEHHANLIPWQQVCKQNKAILKVIPFDADGTLDLQVYKNSLNNRTKLVGLVHISNTLGTINPIAEMIDLAHQKNIPVLIDAAQSITHYNIDVQVLNCDFLVFSGHKMFGPSGIGVLYGKAKYLEQMTPYQFGGDMIRDVTFEETIFAKSPNKFEAGTPNIVGVMGLAYAIDFIKKWNKKAVQSHLQELLQYGTEQLQQINGLKIIGTSPNKSAILSFVMENAHPHDVSTILNEYDVAVRAGHHCTQPIMDRYEIAGTSRASFTIYNQLSDIDRLVEGIKAIKSIFG